MERRDKRQDDEEGRKQLLDDFTEEGILEVESGSTRSQSVENSFGRGYGPVVRDTAELVH